MSIPFFQKQPHRFKQKKGAQKIKQSAFTLVELLVSFALLTILMALLFQIFRQTTHIWKTTEHTSLSYQQARTAIYWIREDLRHALLSEQTPMLINSQKKDSYGDPMVPLDQRSETASTPDSLFFMANLPKERHNSPDFSDLCSIGYYTAYTSPSSASTKKFHLYRYFRESRSTFELLQKNLPAFLFSGGKAEDFFPHRSWKEPTVEKMSNSILSFTIEYLMNSSTLPTGQPAQFPRLTYSSLSQQPQLEAPSQILIRLDFLDPTLAEQLHTRNDWVDRTTPFFQTKIEPFLQTFLFRIALPTPQPFQHYSALIP